MHNRCVVMDNILGCPLFWAAQETALVCCVHVFRVGVTYLGQVPLGAIFFLLRPGLLRPALVPQWSVFV